MRGREEGSGRMSGSLTEVEVEAQFSVSVSPGEVCTLGDIVSGFPS